MKVYDFLFVGAGISGPFVANDLCAAGAHCLMVEAGKFYQRHTYPRNSLDGNANLYWSGGMELGRDCKIAFLRPKVVGGGSIVNQALVDRFDEEAWRGWKETSGVDWFNEEDMAPWYEAAEAEIEIREIPAAFRNENAKIFDEGFKKLGFRNAPLKRAQDDCRLEEGNCCIECLNGCRLGSKQSTPETVLKRALDRGLTLVSEVEVERIITRPDGILELRGRDAQGGLTVHHGRNLVLGAGAVGNSKLLLNSGFGKAPLWKRALGRKTGADSPVGQGFYCHPQFMSFGIYDQPIQSHMGAFQAFKSDDDTFRRQGFKLENVYAGPEAIALLVPGFGAGHHRHMEKLDHFACMEVCTRDAHPGRITVDRKGNHTLHKPLRKDDRQRYEAGREVITQIFETTGAKEIVHGQFAIGLHLMGGCGMGTDPTTSVVDPEFCLHGRENIFSADSSIFPNAPGINPSLTIMALSKKAAQSMLRRCK